MPLPLLPATAQGLLPCSPELICKSLAEYSAWPQWFPTFSSARLLTREDMLALVELGFPGQGGKTAVMECIETPGQGVLARVIEGWAPFREIEWAVRVAEGGFSTVTVTVRRTIGLQLLSPGSRLLNPARSIAALGLWISSGNPRPEIFTDGENLFELWETDAGMVCWVRGKKYVLTPVDEQLGLTS